MESKIISTFIIQQIAAIVMKGDNHKKKMKLWSKIATAIDDEDDIAFRKAVISFIKWYNANSQTP